MKYYLKIYGMQYKNTFNTALFFLRMQNLGQMTIDDLKPLI